MSIERWSNNAIAHKRKSYQKTLLRLPKMMIFIILCKNWFMYHYHSFVNNYQDSEFGGCNVFLKISMYTINTKWNMWLGYHMVTLQKDHIRGTKSSGRTNMTKTVLIWHGYCNIWLGHTFMTTKKLIWHIMTIRKLYYDNIKSAATYMTIETLLWQQHNQYDKILSSLQSHTATWCTYGEVQAGVTLMSFRWRLTALRPPQMAQRETQQRSTMYIVYR